MTESIRTIKKCNVRPRMPISLVMNCPTVYCRAFSVGNLVADIPLVNGRMPDHGWPRVNSQRYTLGYLLSRLYMLMANSIKTLGYYSDSSSGRSCGIRLQYHV